MKLRIERKDNDIRIFDEKGNEIYLEYSNGFWVKSQFDKERNKIYYENSQGYWVKSKFNKDGNEIYYEDSTGEKWGTKAAEEKFKDYKDLDEAIKEAREK
ncbi:MAG TPA: hypothetical protein VGB37_15170 [Candidatus Lokiarchaeia archaeon]